MVASAEIADELAGEPVQVVAIQNLLDKEEIEEKVLPVVKKTVGGGRINVRNLCRNIK